MSRYLVTGCAGFVGSHLTEALLDAGHEVLGVDVFADYYARELKEANIASSHEHHAFSLVEAGLVDLDLDPILDGVDGVFHLAAQPGVRGSWGRSFEQYVHDNLVASQRLFDAASNRGIRVVWASSSSVYGDAEAYPTPEGLTPHPISPYGVTKLACEHLANAYRQGFGLDDVALRYFTVYGPRQRPDMAFMRIIKALLSETPFTLFGTGEQTRDVTYVCDAVSATIASMEKAPAGAVYNVGGGSETAMNRVISLCEELAERRLDLRRVREQEGDVKRTAADTSLIREQLEWRPHWDLLAGLEQQLAWAEAATNASLPSPTLAR